jgi:hypothetical protein
VDLTGAPDKGALHSVSELSLDVECAVIGLTKTNPADAIDDLEEKGIKKFHTSSVKELLII